MSIRAILLASVLGMPLVAGTALAGDLANAAKQGDRNAVQSLLNGPAKQDVAGAEGRAALTWAITRNDAEMVDLLLGAGADPNLQIPDWGGTALIIASTMGQADIVVRGVPA